ncbi:MAG: hypothetical protein HOM14_00340 [Gammaproteobacteria bacterium]|jgi:hypothetical protein|nr:hypothetical protein [Gammaproteobacteria bacterium]MBT7044307.1 hypothetical protein [Gammaproteobacteria bacterium]
MKTGRNDPCPCGSGKKYKHCCLSPASVVNDELKGLLAEQEFDSIDDVQAVADQFMQQKNQLPQDDFQGLSPEQVHRMLHFPFDTPEFFTFPETLSSAPEAPILHLVQEITAAIDEKGLKATAKGNLPLKLCKLAKVDYQKFKPEGDYLYRRNISSEEDFDDLHTARIILELSGLLRKTKGRFFLTKKYQQMIKKSGLTGLYPLLLKTYCRKFNWGFRDGYEEIPFIQHSFLFTMYLLKLHGDDWKLFFIYEDYFLQAFPMVINEAESEPYRSAEDGVRACYSIRTLDRFLHFMGLTSIEKIPGDKPFKREYRIRKLPLLDEVVRFSI